MSVCPKCQTKDRDGAKFCSKCGQKLSAEPRVTTPIDPTQISSISAEGTPSLQISPVKRVGSGTRPLQPLAFSPRPEGAIFDGRFLWKGLTFSDPQQQGYVVTEMVSEPSWLQCAACGAVQAFDKYCTECQALLDSQHGPALTLFEAQSKEAFGRGFDLASQGLTHTYLRAPLAAFSEMLGATPRYCVVMPQVRPLASRPERTQVLGWASGLAQALDYLHNLCGVSFQGKVDETRFGLDQGRAVWCDFRQCIVYDGIAPDLAMDVRALARQLYTWLTGQTQYAPDPLVAPAVNSVFERALAAGFATGQDLAAAFEQARAEASAAAAQSVDFRIGRRTDVGRVRTLNEDSMLALEVSRTQQSICQPLGVYVVADGMGGHAAGEVASGTIINSIAQKAGADLVASVAAGDRLTWLQEAIGAANSAVFNLRKSIGTDMGSTLAMAVIEGIHAYVGHVGDSRAYLINPQGIHRLTTDHSLVERLVATNQITREEARTHDQRNVIYRTMGDKPRVEADPSKHTLAPGDRLLLCSDGLSGMVADDLIRKIVMEQASPQAACDALIDAANAAGGEDNITVIVIQLD